jgi:hypothetical protein
LPQGKNLGQQRCCDGRVLSADAPSSGGCLARISLQVPTQASQMKTFGPAMRRLTWLSGRPQNEQASLDFIVLLLDPRIADPVLEAQPRDPT